MTKQQIKKPIIKGDRLSIQLAIFKRWKLEDRLMIRLPYKDSS